VAREKGLPPRPEEIADLLRDLAREMALLLAEYRWLHGTTYDPPRGSGDYTTGSREPDRAGSLLANRNRSHARKAMVKAREAILNAKSQLQEAEVQLGHGLPRLQGRPSIEPEQEEYPTVSTAEMAKSQEAQVRRHERGEGFGEG